MVLKLNNTMLLGTATAAAQIEGGDTVSSWQDWANRGGTKDGSTPKRGNDHYVRFKEDIALMQQMKMQIYRFGLEWSRIEPQRGFFSQEAIDHYREEIQLLQKAGIKVLVTLHHFANPMWFENIGAFEHPDSPLIFLSYVRYAVTALADLVDEWITINEPNIYTVNGYFFGTWPPGKKNFRSLQTVYKNTAVSHILAYKEIHKIRRASGFLPNATRVSFANHLRVFKPRVWWNIVHILSSAFMNNAFQMSLTDAFSRGVFSFPVGQPSKKSPWGSIARGRYYDFIGINYYTRSAVSCMKDGYFSGKPVNDLGWEIYPEGIAECARMMYKKYHAPVYITENGTCDKEDSFRSRYIFDHLKSLVESGLPVERYYHWTFIDNFEWAEGETAPFGLVSLNFDTQERTIKKSGRFFTQIIDNGGVTESMYDEFVR